MNICIVHFLGYCEKCWYEHSQTKSVFIVLGIYLGAELLGHMVILYLNFYETI